MVLIVIILVERKYRLSDHPPYHFLNFSNQCTQLFPFYTFSTILIHSMCFDLVNHLFQHFLKGSPEPPTSSWKVRFELAYLS